tara:strand:+ start:245 stop:445 length:201 start_codon:yes stop_codon:yes gene_type:complete
MEQASNLVGNPIALLIERIFWLGLGLFLVGTIFKAFIGSINKGKSKESSMEAKLKEIANKVVQEND